MQHAYRFIARSIRQYDFWSWQSTLARLCLALSTIALLADVHRNASLNLSVIAGCQQVFNLHGAAHLYLCGSVVCREALLQPCEHISMASRRPPVAFVCHVALWWILFGLECVHALWRWCFRWNASLLRQQYINLFLRLFCRKCGDLWNIRWLPASSTPHRISSSQFCCDIFQMIFRVNVNSIYALWMSAVLSHL